MLTTTLLFAVLLILIGLVGYVGTGMVSATALIPTFFGLIVLLLWLLGRGESRRKIAMHGAQLLALLALIGTARALPSFFSVLAGGEVERQAAVISQGLVALLCILYLLLGIKSFIAARRASG